MKRFALVLALVPSFALAANFKFTFNKEDVTKVVDAYSKATGQKFIIDPAVRGQTTILGADNVSPEEAFNLLSSSLASNGYAISTQGDTMMITSARNTQRSLIETTNRLPALKPERMVTYVVTLKYVAADDVNRQLRIFPSRDGEMSVFTPRNQILITDYTSNLHRIDTILKEIDIPADPKAPQSKSTGKKSAATTKTMVQEEASTQE